MGVYQIVRSLFYWFPNFAAEYFKQYQDQRESKCNGVWFVRCMEIHKLFQIPKPSENLYWFCQEWLKGWRITVEEYGNERKDLKRRDEFLIMLESIDGSVINSSKSEFQGS